jgi:imidazolonepropionase-like amidohydrolase
MKRNVLFFIGFFSSLVVWSQPTRWENGPRDDRKTLYAFTDARIQVTPTQQISSGILLVQDGKIIDVGTQVKIPQGAVVISVHQSIIYPAFIDAWSTYGIDSKPISSRSMSGAQQSPERWGAFAVNDAIHSDFSAADAFRVQADPATKLRKMGIGLTSSFIEDGIARGTSAAFFTGTEEESQMLLKTAIGRHFSFQKGSSKEAYPEALMGAVALLRQTHLDALWYQNTQPAFRDLALEQWNQTLGLPDFFDARGSYDVVRFAEIAQEWKRPQAIVRGNGSEYQYIQSIKKYPSLKLILPLTFPDALDVENPLDAQKVSLEELKNWELAPSNPAIVAQNNIPFAFTASGLKPSEDIFALTRLCLQYGLDYATALAAWTTTPAQMMGIQHEIGTIEKGKWANFIICTDSLFSEANQLKEIWIKGIKYSIQQQDSLLVSGKYTLHWAGKTFPVEITKNTSISGKWWPDSSSSDFSWNYFQGNVTGNLTFQKKNLRLFGWVIPDGVQGKITNEMGQEMPFTLELVSSTPSKKTSPQKWATWNIPSEKFYPQVGLGAAKPWNEQPSINALISNTTIWTMGKDSVYVGDVRIKNGKIVALGKHLEREPNITIIDGTGMHLTPGIIDEHSHIAITRGVNEGSRYISSECDIDDALDCSDINIYRQLSGGVTTAHLLHGSANAIGGQTALIKLRWGVTAPQELRFVGADPFIKFALGENPKQSNWGEQPKIRYPQSRMGVEQVYIDAFMRAKEYEKNRNEWKANGSKKEVEPRPDLMLETLVRILHHQEHITCHSYVQSEINMLIHVADSLGFKVNTFTHVLEGYKIADKIKAHGASASTFSDWWAYKYEVIDAIPHNAALLTQAGVNTCINSDDAEMARRLNQEAAKSIRFGGLSPIQALSMVTINPAKALHIDKQVGSIEVGKDADMVLWTNDPLSIDAQVFMTVVDGKIAFDRKVDNQQQIRMKAEKERIIQKMLEAKKAGKPTSKPIIKEKRLYHCDSRGE